MNCKSIGHNYQNFLTTKTACWLSYKISLYKIRWLFIFTWTHAYLRHMILSDHRIQFWMCFSARVKIISSEINCCESYILSSDLCVDRWRTRSSATTTPRDDTGNARSSSTIQCNKGPTRVTTAGVDTTFFIAYISLKLISVENICYILQMLTLYTRKLMTVPMIIRLKIWFS